MVALVTIFTTPEKHIECVFLFLTIEAVLLHISPYFVKFLGNIFGSVFGEYLYGHW